MMMKASEFAENLAKSLKSIAKVALLSSKAIAPRKCSKPSGRIIVLGNGPSLKQTIEEHAQLLRQEPTLAVNFMANSPAFADLKPDYYVIADPLFFEQTSLENVEKLWREIARIDWPMTLVVPTKRLKTVKRLVGDKNSNIKYATFNYLGAEGFPWLEARLYDCRRAMPRPRNVLIPAIMTAISAGYNEIDIVGADHSWMETIRVTDENHVVSVQPHFYKDSKAELRRSEEAYKGYRLHQIVESFAIAFKSYHTLQRYAKRRGINIYNATPGSYIDAFERRSL